MTTIQQNLGIISGAYATKQLFTGSLGGFLKASVAGAASAALLQSNWKLAGVAASIGVSASGWRDLAHLKFKTGLAKIFLGSAAGAGATASINNQDIGSLTLRDAGLASGFFAGAGLVQAVVEGTWPYVQMGCSCLARTLSCCNDLAEECFKKEKQDAHPRYSSAVKYC
ncbi:MAG: hypothetical protein K1X28_08160 [Parachlamydiales bacterium]|nr:hypothetical protein [Parachlamydiales bacterium]